MNKARKSIKGRKARNPAKVKLIHTAARSLGLTEEERRTIYKDATGYDTIKDMDDFDLVRVIERLRGVGFAPAKKHKGVVLDSSPQARKIRHLWLELKNLGVLRDSSETALLNYIKKRTGVERMEWLDPGQKAWIIEQLKAWHTREEDKKHLIES